MSQSADLLGIVMLALNHCRKRGKGHPGWIVAALDKGGGCMTVEFSELPPPVVGGVAVNLRDWSLYLGVCEFDGSDCLLAIWRPLSVSMRGGC